MREWSNQEKNRMRAEWDNRNSSYERRGQACRCMTGGSHRIWSSMRAWAGEHEGGLKHGRTRGKHTGGALETRDRQSKRRTFSGGRKTFSRKQIAKLRSESAVSRQL